jgi:hypothetical protein
MNLDKIGLQVPEILLPKTGTNMRNWAVIACDQYTSDLSYWKRLEQQVGAELTTLNLIFPEVYLEDSDGDQRIEAINEAMEKYLADGSLEEQPAGFVLVDRKTTEVESRKGLMVALDLEQYDYSKGSKSMIRATEGTIVDRLPPRIRVRENAPIELPHIMVLIDDPQRTVIEPLFDAELETLYDFELLENGGHLKGYRVAAPELVAQVTGALEKLVDPAAYRSKYAVEEDEVMLYAMGDGNHSFATAKAIWEQLKEEAIDKVAIMNHPARFALVELVNLHDAGLEFEAIHRVMFNLDPQQLKSAMMAWFAARDTPLSMSVCASLVEAQGQVAAATHGFIATFGGEFVVCSIENPEYSLEVASLQAFIDQYLEANTESRVDYIHGEGPVTELGGKPDCAGFYLPAIAKDDFFRTIIVDGAFPRKTFSMGEADEKRFYLECRRIKEPRQ